MSTYCNRLLNITVILLVVVGLCFSASTSFWAKESGNTYGMFWRQIFFLVVGVGAAAFLRYTSETLLSRFYWWLYALGIIGVLLCYIPGIGKTVHGASRWVSLGGSFTIQTSEFAKITTLIALGSWFKFNASHIHSFWKGFIIPGIIIAIPFITIFLQTDMGTALGLGCTGLIVMVLIGSPLRYIAPTLLGGVALVAIIISFNANRMDRIEQWQKLDKVEYRYELLKGTGRQQLLARDGMQAGNLTGVGYAQGTKNKQADLPFAHTDFIFAIICEELGFIGSASIVLLYGILAVCGLIITSLSSSVYNRVLSCGAIAMLIVPSCLNMMVVTGVLPNSGLPLPFISYGGSSLISSLMAIGLLSRAASQIKVQIPLDNLQRRINLPLSAISYQPLDHLPSTTSKIDLNPIRQEELEDESFKIRRSWKDNS